MHLPKFLRKKKDTTKEIKDEEILDNQGRSKTAKNPLIIFLNFVFMSLVFVVVIGALVLYSIKTIYERPSQTTEAQSIVIPTGMGINGIAKLLDDKGIISSEHIFIYGAYLKDKTRYMKAGEFEIPASASMQEVADIIVSGKSVQHSITVPEGITVFQLFAKLADETLMSGELPAQLPIEGSLMADTIHFVRGTSRSDIISRLRNAQTQLVDKIWAERDQNIPLKNKEEMIILASIVEKETGIARERPQIAAVFYNRLAQKMRLQSDPTVIYGIFGGEGKPANRAIYRSDLDKDNPYNTYKIFGLPPTPICIPGRSALEAVANPPQTEDLYFVADGTGGHIFSRTLNEHNNNVAKWRKIKQTQQQNSDSSIQESN